MPLTALGIFCNRYMSKVVCHNLEYLLLLDFLPIIQLPLISMSDVQMSITDLCACNTGNLKTKECQLSSDDI